MDKFGIKYLYSSEKGNNWISNWGPLRTLRSVGEDPDDSKCWMRGSGQIAMGQDLLTFTLNPRYYVIQDNKNVEITSYFKLNDWANPVSYSGFTIVTRSNHHLYKSDPCKARSYYCRLWNNGEIGFQQEYRHGTNTSYSPSKRIRLYDKIPKNIWIGMKFCVFDTEEGDTILQVFIDETNGENGGEWQLAYELNALEFGGEDPCDAPKPIPNGGCSFFRTDRADTVQMKWASIREIKPVPYRSSNIILWLLLIIPLLLLLAGISMLLYYKK